MEGKDENGRGRTSFSPDPATESSMLKEGVPQNGDGLILSSFQVLEHREEEAGKTGPSLEHFLHPFDHTDRVSLGVDDDGQWKTSNIEPLDCRINAEARAQVLPEVDSLTSADHAVGSFRRDFLHDALSDAQGGQGSELLRVGKAADDGNGVSDDGQAETDVERCQAIASSSILVLEDRIHQSKQVNFEGIEVETPDLVSSHKRGYFEMQSDLANDGLMSGPATRDVWSQMGHAGAETVVNEWTHRVKTKDGNVTDLAESEAGKSWVFLHSNQHQPLWEVPGAESQAHHQNFMPPDANVVSRSSHWSRQTRAVAEQQRSGDGLPWMPDVGDIYQVESSVGNACKVYPVTPTSSNNIPAPSVTTLAELQPYNPCNVQWPVENQFRTVRPGGVFPPRPGPTRESPMCRRMPVPCLHPMPSQNFYRCQGPVAGQPDIWPQAVPIHSSSPGPRCVEAATTIPPPSLCPAPGTSKRPVPRRSGVVMTPAMTPVMTPNGNVPKTRPLLDQARVQAHPYLMKDSKKTVRDVFSGTSANVHTLKASHIVSWYIDYLIHENEHLTQISRAFSLPVNLFHSDDFYFMESVKKKVHFPSLKFLSWMQQNLPSINVNAVDFHEGRPPVVSVWNQDWFWQNKSRRDIIHDVFFYFQHRRVTCPI